MYPDTLLYTKDHEWMDKTADGGRRVGLTDWASKELGDIVYIELPEEGDEFAKGASFGTVESVKAVSDIYMPVAGKIVAVNSALEDSPELVNKSAQDEGWIVKIELTDDGEMKDLLEAAAYEEHLAAQE